MKILSYRRFALWWQLAMDWFQRQFAAIAASIDFTPVEDKLDEVKSDVADVKTAVENINVESADQVAQFFGLPEALPGSYQALTPAEAIAIARDCQYNVMGTDWPIPTWLPTGVTEAQVESAAEGLGIPYHEPTQTA